MYENDTPDSSVSVVTGLRAGELGFGSRQRRGFFFRRVQTGCGAHPDSCVVGTGDPFLQLVPRLRIRGAVLHSPIRLQGVLSG